MSNRALHMDNNGMIRPRRPHGDQPTPRARIILFVHGYNNDSNDANNSYYTMRKNLDDSLRESGLSRETRNTFQKEIWELYWPGYYGIDQPSSVVRLVGEKGISTASYSLQVLKAKDWVPKGLAEYLESLDPSGVFFVGHSLGCRVVLETIKRLARTNVPVLGFLLMAGAVPTDLLDEKQDLYAGNGQGKHQYCLFSAEDFVLKACFPPGQILAGEWPEEGGLPVATGRVGQPRSMYAARSNTGLGHSGYWDQGPRKSGRIFAKVMAHMLGVATRSELIENKLSNGRMPDSYRNTLPIITLNLRKLSHAEAMLEDYAPDKP